MNKKILILNWRSPYDPKAGGAEVATLEHAKRWHSAHHAEITWISPRYSLVAGESREGVNFKYISPPLGASAIRKLVFFPIFFFSVALYLLKNSKNYDVVIDEFHGIGHLTPLFSKTKNIVYIHEVAGAIWDKMYPFPINLIGKFCENLFFIFYKNTKFVTVSDSTKNDLLNYKISSDQISIVHNGISTSFINTLVDASQRFPKTILFLNRLVPMKGPEDALLALNKVKEKFPDIKLIMSGRGDVEYKNKLKQKASERGLLNNVDFVYLSESEKAEMMSKVSVFINCSMKEGWGLVNLEANSRGTFVISYKTLGNVDSIQEGINGWLVEPTPDALAEKICEFLNISDKRVYYENALKYSKQFNWDIQAERFYQLL